MNINFQTITDKKTTHDGVLSGMEAQGRIASGPSKTTGTNTAGFALDLDATGFTDNAYGKHARTVDDIAKEAQNTDLFNQHNFMALLSNTMSEEDYQKALEDGFDIKDINSKEAVTIVDKIKSVLLQSGTMVEGYNDDLSLDKLKRITGSDTMANAIQKSFHENDIPVTAENVKASKIAMEQIEDIQALDDGAVKYMVQNNMKPTIENIYFASHSTNGQNTTGRGFYAQDADGYYAKKADSFDFDQLKPQIESVIEEADLDPKDTATYDNAKWMVTQGIPLTPENLVAVNEIRSIQFPVSIEAGALATAAAISDGKRAIDADLYDPASNYKKAAVIADKVDKITDDDIKSNIISGKELTINNLSQAKAPQTQESLPDDDARLIKARLQVEEVRLRMSVDANKTMLDKGFAIDTEPIEEVINQLKSVLGQMAGESAGKALDEIRGVTPENSGYVMQMTLSRVSVIAQGPAAIVGEVSKELYEESLLKISNRSEALTENYSKAGAEYEKLMTAPRADLGDSIKKAFRNVDDILKDLGQELTDENRRAVRILGYNNMEITPDNIEKVRSFDVKLQSVVSRLKPGAVLDLIRDGQNPLSMTIDELSKSMDDHSSSSEDNRGKSEEKYARFLFKLEKKKEISQEERASYIGIYRLFNTLKTTDYQAIGSVLKTGRDMTIGNLLEATRNQKASRKGMDYRIDDDFGGISLKENGEGPNIDEQISTAFRYYQAKAEVVYENLEPEKLMNAAPTNETLLPELADKLSREEVDQELERAYVKEQIGRIRQISQQKATEPALDEITISQIETTFNNIEAMISTRRDRRYGDIWNRAKDPSLKALLQDKLEDDDYQENYVKILGDFSDKLSEELMISQDTYIDVRAIALLQKQISVITKSSENDSFEVPVDVDGQTVSMHVTLKNDGNVSSRMDASVWTDEYGLLSVSLSLESGVVKGMLTTTNGSNQEESEYLESVRTRLCDKLQHKVEDAVVDARNIPILYRVQSGTPGSGAVTNKAMEGEKVTPTETRTLLTMAKAFIEAL